jgi:predicted TPR repeat methyltransferase
MDRLHVSLPIFAKRYAWNMKYGLFRYPELTAPEDAIRYLSSRLAEFSSVLELGCGRGSLLRGLRQAGWTGSYCGVDISKRAINAAQRLGDQRSAWVVSDFESFRSPFRWDIVVMIESIYYAKLGDLQGLLNRVMVTVSESGFLLIRLHDFDKHREYVETVQAFSKDVKRLSPNLLCVDHSRINQLQPH